MNGRLPLLPMTSLPLAAVPLSGYTTLRVGGPATRFVSAESAEEGVTATRQTRDRLPVLGGGSNLVIADKGFDGTVVRVANRGSKIDSLGDGRVALTVEAGEDWDAVVRQTVEAGLGGLECLSGIPGSVGATPVQNVGAYGVEIGQLLISVELLDRAGGGAWAAAGQGDGPGPGRPRHVERGLVLHEPGGHGGGPARGARTDRVGRRRGDAGAAVPGGRGHVEAVGGVADRTCRLREGLPGRGRPGGAVEQAHPGPHQPGPRDDVGDPRPGKGGPRRRAHDVRRHPGRGAGAGGLHALAVESRAHSRCTRDADAWARGFITIWSRFTCDGLVTANVTTSATSSAVSGVSPEYTPSARAASPSKRTSENSVSTRPGSTSVNRTGSPSSSPRNVRCNADWACLALV